MAVLVVCAGGLTAVAMQVRCIDAAREAARLAARGDETSAVAAARGVGPTGATLQLRRDGSFVVATVSGHSRLLPGVTIRADAIAAVEPGS
ncbi:pilus biosynthesis protein TadE [Mycolicibacterium sphagni]|uniref:Pilus biosynthesis protein TadE n=1 Tax=Mycolicibacterium sphagni TaxID=1786 RepID=A0ABX2JXP7_9MYCO|nr:pilus biosynthesis protein TadE [Mycolicibacterium sphagni]